MYLRTPDNHDARTSESSLRSQMWSPACVEHIPARVSLTITSLYHPRTMHRVALLGRSPYLRYGLRSLPRTGEVKRVLHSKLDLGQTSRQESFARVPETRRALLHLHLQCQTAKIAQIALLGRLQNETICTCKFIFGIKIDSTLFISRSWIEQK